MSDTDLELLQRYTRDRAEDAFAELVRRHLDLVHSAALRQVRFRQLAEDVSQSVFTDLARNADRLAPDTILTAWLYQVTRRTAIDVVRREARRQLREQIATEMNAMNATTAEWTHIEPLLDEAMSALDETDRAAVLLRYFENKSLREVGQTLGTSDDAAQKRVGRAVERLREFFAKRGVTVSASGLVVVISANAVQAAPVGLAVTISTAAALAGTTIVTTATATAIKAIAMTTLQKTVITATLAVLAGAGIYEARQASQLREQNHTLQQLQAPMIEQSQQLQRERDEATNRLAALNDEFVKNKKDNLELLKLRGEVTRLRRESQELAQVKSNAATKDEGDLANQSWLDRVKLLKQRLEQTPSEKNPEIQFLTEDDWLFAAKRKLDTDVDYRAAFSELRGRGEGNFLQKADSALHNYLATNSNVFPTDLSQLKLFFNNPPPDEILQRYEIVPADSLPQANISGNTGGWLITLKSPDSGALLALGTNGVGGSHYDAENSMGILAPAVKAALDAAPMINGRRNVELQQLEPYLTTPEQKAAYQRLMKSHKPASQ